MLSSPNVPPCDTTHQPGKTSQGVRWHLHFFFFKGTETNQSLGMARLLIPRTVPKSDLRGGESGNGIRERDSPPPVVLQNRYDHVGRTRSILLLPDPRLRQQSIRSPASTFPHCLPRNQDSLLGRGRQFPHTC